MITEKSSITRNVRICGGERRERNIYTSRLNTIDIRISTRNSIDQYHAMTAEYFFLFQFAGLLTRSRTHLPIVSRCCCRSRLAHPITVRDIDRRRRWLLFVGGCRLEWRQSLSRVRAVRFLPPILMRRFACCIWHI